MFNHRFDERPGAVVTAHWFMMSFSAGWVNAGGFLGTERFVSHVTGFATLFGVDLAVGKYEAAAGILSVPLFFLLGSFLSGLLVDRQVHLGRKPHFDYVMVLSAVCLYAAASLNETTEVGEFGETVRLKQAYLLLVLLCLASGLQNAAVTASSGRTVRTTHLTGITTDLGVGIAKLLTFNFDRARFFQEVEWNYLRAGTIGSFIAGSAAGAFAFLQMGYSGFYVPAVIATYAAWHGRRAKAGAPSVAAGQASVTHPRERRP